MSVIPVNLAVEDELSEYVLRRLLNDAQRGYEVGTVYGHGGFGYLRRNINGWNSAAKGRPFIVLTDLDKADCAPTLIDDWLTAPKRHNLILRVAVREVEAWLLGDQANLARHLSCRVTKMPEEPDSLPDPKRTLIDIAKESRSSATRSRLVPKKGSTAKQGPDYNACLSEFVRGSWDPVEAAQRSASLTRTVARLGLFTPIWPQPGNEY